MFHTLIRGFLPSVILRFGFNLCLFLPGLESFFVGANGAFVMACASL